MTPAIVNVRTRQVTALRRPTVRSVWWPPALVAALLAPVLLVWRDDAMDEAGSALVLVRMIAVLLAIGAVFVLDDDAAVTVAASPTPLSWRRALRYGAAAVLLLPAWAGVLVYAQARQPELPAMRLTLELATLALLGLAFAAAATRWWGVSDPGMGAALVVLGVSLAGALAPSPLALFTSPGAEAWQPSTIRWTSLLLGAVSLLAVATRDPAVTFRQPSPSS